MRFFQRRREKDADWLQQMEGNWSDRHGSCYEVFRDAAYKGTSYSCSVRIQRPSGEAFSRPAVIKQVEDGTIIWGQKYILDETHSTQDSLSWKNLRGYSGFSWQRMKPRASAPKAAEVQGGEDCRVHPAPPPPPPPAEKPQDTGHKDPASRLGWTPTVWTRRTLPKQAEKEEKKKEETEEKEKAKEEKEEDQDLYAEAATEDTSEPSADAEAKQVATTDQSSLEIDDSGDPAKVEDAWEGSHAAHIPNKHWNNRARVAWDASDTAEDDQAYESKIFTWRSRTSGQSHPQPAESKPQKVPTPPPPPPPPAKSPDLTDDSRSEQIIEQIAATPSAQEEEPKLALTGNVSVAADGTAIYEGDVDAFDGDTNRGTIYSRGASADYDGDAIYVPGDLLASSHAAVEDSVCFSVKKNEDGELVAEVLLRLKASGSDRFALSGIYKTASGHIAGNIECAEVRKLFDFDVQVSHEVADRGLFLTGQEVAFNARFVLMADLSGKLEATELRLVEEALQQPQRERLSEEMLAPFHDPKLGEAANPAVELIPDRELWRKELDRLIRDEDIIHL